MEMEMKQLESYSLFINTAGTPSLSPAADTTDVLRYTSLRDIIPSSPRAAGSSRCFMWLGRDVRGPLLVDSAAISIRNRLVKHAASAYLQSAASLHSRNQSCLARLWAWVSSGAGWSCYVQRPLSSCVDYVVQWVRWIMACMVGQVGGMWGGGGGTPIWILHS